MTDGTYSTIYDLLYSVSQVSSAELADYIIELIQESKCLDDDEVNVLNEFLSLKKEVKGIPTPKTLVSRNIMYSTANTIQEDALEDIAKIFIYNKDNSRKAAILTNMAMELTKPGHDENKIAETVSNLFAREDEDEEYINPYDIDEKLKELHDIEEVHGIKYGIPCIDEIYPGTTSKSFTVIAGYTGSMKTTLAVNHCFLHMLQGKNVLYFSLEVSEEEILMSLMSLYTISCTNEPIKKEDIKKMRNNNKEKFDKIYTDLMSLPGKIVFRDESTLKMSSQSVYTGIIRKVDKELKDRFNKGLDLIVLDHAQMLKYDSDSKGNKDPYQVLNRWTDFFRRFASRDGYAVILVSQTSRGGYEYACKHGGQYLLTGLAEGNELERGATCVIALFSNEESKASGEISVQILKNRFGPVMLEPQTTTVKPEYYLVGNGYNASAQQVDAIFEDGEMPNNPFENQEVENLDSLLGGM